MVMDGLTGDDTVPAMTMNEEILRAKRCCLAYSSFVR